MAAPQFRRILASVAKRKMLPTTTSSRTCSELVRCMEVAGAALSHLGGTVIGREMQQHRGQPQNENHCHPLTKVVLTNYSYLNAVNGSTFVARRAGR